MTDAIDAPNKSNLRFILSPSRWRMLYYQEFVLRKFIREQFLYAGMALVSGALTIFCLVKIGDWSVALIFGGFFVFTGFFTVSIWLDRRDIFIPLLSGDAILGSMPDCLAVSSALVSAGMRDDVSAQREVGEIYRRAAEDRQGLERLQLFHAAEIWLDKAARHGDHEAQKTLAEHYGRCGQHEEAEIWGRIASEGIHRERGSVWPRIQEIKKERALAAKEARAGAFAWLTRWRWSAIVGEFKVGITREKSVADLSDPEGGNWGKGIRTAAETAMRGKALLIGLWFAFVGLVIVWISTPYLLKLFAVPPAKAEDWLWPVVGTAVGAYLLLARGLGPIQSALSWSRLRGDTHGKARWATLKEVRKAGLTTCENSVYLGRFLENDRAQDRVGYPGPTHLITIGPNNSGKGTGLIIPNLASLKRSIFIIDPKGEAAAITARARRKFGPVKIINPFNVLVDQLPSLRSGGFNPLAALDPRHDNFTDDCVGIAQALVKEEAGSSGAFFSGSAQDLLTALIMYEKLERGQNASLGNVRKMLTEPYGEDRDGNAVGLAQTILKMSESEYDPLRSKANRFKVGSKSVMDIISTASNETRLLDSPALQRDLSGEAINWDSMKEQITTVYLILPSDRLETHANFLRLVVTSALRTLLRSPPSAKLPPVLFMLDEFAQLGYLAPIENAMGIARGFGVQLWPFLQDLNQLHALYKDRWQTFIGARGVLTAFAPQDMFTADYLSKLCGNRTVIVESENVRSDSGLPGGGRSAQGLPLIRPDELMRMPAGQMLCFVDPVKHPFITKAPGYWETSFAHGLGDNPYYRG